MMTPALFSLRAFAPLRALGKDRAAARLTLSWVRAEAQRRGGERAGG
jgi:hypothetical protein